MRQRGRPLSPRVTAKHLALRHLLKVLSSLKIAFCVMSTFVSQFAEFSDLAGEVCFQSSFTSTVPCSFNHVFNVAVFSMDA